MFSSVGHFSQILCPVNGSCDLTSCFFRHPKAPSAQPIPCSASFPKDNISKKRHLGSESDVPRKSPRIGQTLQSRTLESSSSYPHDDIRETRREMKHREASPSFESRSKQSKKVVSPEQCDLIPDSDKTSEAKTAKLPSKIGASGNPDSTTTRAAASLRAVSPPSTKRGHESRSAAGTPKKASRAQEALMPRVLKRAPAQYNIRLAYLKALHTELTRLNNLAVVSKDQKIKILAYTSNEMITLALDMEELIATGENSSLYANILRQKVARYKKMSFADWQSEVLKNTAEASSSPKGDGGFLAEQFSDDKISRVMERLPRLALDQKGLVAHGLVTVQPTQLELEKANEAERISQGLKTCQRCKAKFTVFPERRADGSLTSGGTCYFHEGRLKVDRGSGTKIWDCCKQLQSVGLTCTEHPNHVFRADDAASLATVLQFEHTPENPHALKNRAVVFDCEMGWTTSGFEVIRLTALCWPKMEKLIDVLVRPYGAVLDLATRFSGVHAEAFATAPAYPGKDKGNSETDLGSVNKTLYKVDSPAAARRLMFDLISPEIALIGHAVYNDLTVLRIIHPTVIDTCALYPHPRGLPYRLALKMLCKDYLDRNIQVGGAAGHDSKEDAIATGDLLKLSVAKRLR